ncbi:MAG: hypothetical protein IPJ71_08740 [Bdellovibrionales bacterium]|nr:hypothetical protein [Bdellovibrionales bacterium]
MAYFQYNIFVTIAGFSSYLAFSVCGPYHFAQAQSASNTQCVNALNEAKETCEHSPEVQITYPSPSDGLAVMSESQISNAIINEARFAAKAKECDKAINICESQCPQASNLVEGLETATTAPLPAQNLFVEKLSVATTKLIWQNLNVTDRKYNDSRR